MTSPIPKAGQQIPPSPQRTEETKPRTTSSQFASLLDSFGGTPPKIDFLALDQAGIASADPFNADGFFPDGRPIDAKPASADSAPLPMDKGELEAQVAALVQEFAFAAASGTSGGPPAELPQSTLPPARQAAGSRGPAARRPVPPHTGMARPYVPEPLSFLDAAPQASLAGSAPQPARAKAARLWVMIDGSSVRIIGPSFLTKDEEISLAQQVGDLLFGHGLLPSGIWLNGRLIAPRHKDNR